MLFLKHNAYIAALTSCILMSMSMSMSASSRSDSKNSILVNSVYENQLTTTSIEDCYNLTPLYTIAAVRFIVHDFFPKGISNDIMFRTKIYDIDKKYENRRAFAAKYEALGLGKPLDYVLIFSERESSENSTFVLEEISGSLLSKNMSQKDLKKGLCDVTQEIALRIHAR